MTACADLVLVADDFCCSTDNGWMPITDSIQTMTTHCDSAYLVYSIDIGGFRGQQQFVSEASDVAQISFVFETSCTQDCVFHFIEVSRCLPPLARLPQV